MGCTSRGDQGSVRKERPVVLSFNTVWKGDVQNGRCCQTHDQPMQCVRPVQRFASQQYAAKIIRGEIKQAFWDDIDEQVRPLRQLESRRYNQRDSFRVRFDKVAVQPSCAASRVTRCTTVTRSSLSLLNCSPYLRIKKSWQH